MRREAEGLGMREGKAKFDNALHSSRVPQRFTLLAKGAGLTPNG